MGGGLRKPVTSLPVTRRGGKQFHVGMAEMNGVRGSMEDGHVIHIEDDWGFFGVFDGHGGSQCSSYITKRMEEELETHGRPVDDAAVKELVLRLDEEFLGNKIESGSTGTFVIIEVPKAPDQFHMLRVGNVGDSRVLLGKMDGQMVEGQGTDGGLTTDHKPNNEIERRRIEKAGGYVKDSCGVHRVNGELAVSRAFGDKHFKHSDMDDEARPEERIVSAEPELCSQQCDNRDCSHFVLLVCDGISEGNFPNREVVELAAQQLRVHGDPARAAVAVCRKALIRDSKDNLTCMVVLLNGPRNGTISDDEKDEFLPGQFWDMLGDKKFREAYRVMAERGGKTLAEAVEMRFDLALKDLTTLEELFAIHAGRGELGPEATAAIEEVFVCGHEAVGEEGLQRVDADIKALKSEIMRFGEGPSCSQPGSVQRREWFERFVAAQAALEPESNPQADLLKLLTQSAPSSPSTQVLAQAPEPVPVEENKNQWSVRYPVRAIRDKDAMRAAFTLHPDVVWNERLFEVCGEQGLATEVNADDGTTHVRFEPPLGFTAWLPTSILTRLLQDEDRIKVAKAEDLERIVRDHPGMEWDARLQITCEREGTVEEVSTDGTACVRFDSIKAWLPQAALEHIES